MITLTVKEIPLSDNSKSYDVEMQYEHGGGKIVFPAISMRDAIELQVKLSEAVTTHTNNEVRWR